MDSYLDDNDFLCGRDQFIVLLPNVKYKDRFISSLKEELLSLKNVKYNLYYCLQTKYGKIDFWDQIESQFAWSDNNMYDDDFKDRGYQEDWDQFVRYSIIHKDLFHKNKIDDVDMYVKGVYDKLVSKKSSDVRHTILVVNKVSNVKIVKNKSLKSFLDYKALKILYVKHKQGTKRKRESFILRLVQSRLK